MQFLRHNMSFPFAVLALLLSLGGFKTYGENPSTQPWNICILPASINEDRTVRLIEGYTQPLIMQIQAQKTVTDSAPKHDVTICLDLPEGITIPETQGRFTLKKESSSQKHERNLLEYQFTIPNTYILGIPGSRLRPEWKAQTFLLNVPKNFRALKQENYISLTWTWNGKKGTQTWPLEVLPLAIPGRQPQKTRVALWQYNYSAKDASTEEQLAEFLAAAGVNHMQKDVSPDYSRAMKKYGITTGGYVHHNRFFRSDLADYDAEGKKRTGGYPSAQDVIDLPDNAEIPGVKTLVDGAKEYNGIATFDYEPQGPNRGFSPASVAAFKDQYNIRDEDFQKFRRAMARHGIKTYLQKDPEIQRLYQHWVEFRTKQCAAYLRRVYDAAKKKNPEIQIEVTTNDSFADAGLRTLSRGYNAAALSPYVDAILPQIYTGCGGAAAKRTILYTRGWRKSMDAKKAKSKLYPVLLVRYAGAVVYNSPARLRQQILGVLAEGANGFFLYYPTNMDAPYWRMLARTTRDIRRREDFFRHGKRVDEEFPLKNMPSGSAELDVWPAHKETVKDPQWHFTAHRKGRQRLLTLFNLQEANDLLFPVGIPDGYKVVRLEGARELGAPAGRDRTWIVKPKDIGFILLDK